MTSYALSENNKITNNENHSNQYLKVNHNAPQTHYFNYLILPNSIRDHYLIELKHNTETDSFYEYTNERLQSVLQELETLNVLYASLPDNEQNTQIRHEISQKQQFLSREIEPLSLLNTRLFALIEHKNTVNNWDLAGTSVIRRDIYSLQRTPEKIHEYETAKLYFSLTNTLDFDKQDLMVSLTGEQITQLNEFSHKHTKTMIENIDFYSLKGDDFALLANYKRAIMAKADTEITAAYDYFLTIKSTNDFVRNHRALIEQQEEKLARAIQQISNSHQKDKYIKEHRQSSQLELEEHIALNIEKINLERVNQSIDILRNEIKAETKRVKSQKDQVTLTEFKHQLIYRKHVLKKFNRDMERFSEMLVESNDPVEKFLNHYIALPNNKQRMALLANRPSEISFKQLKEAADKKNVQALLKLEDIMTQHNALKPHIYEARIAKADKHYRKMNQAVIQLERDVDAIKNTDNFMTLTQYFTPRHDQTMSLENTTELRHLMNKSRNIISSTDTLTEMKNMDTFINIYTLYSEEERYAFLKKEIHQFDPVKLQERIQYARQMSELKIGEAIKGGMAYNDAREKHLADERIMRQLSHDLKELSSEAMKVDTLIDQANAFSQNTPGLTLLSASSVVPDRRYAIASMPSVVPDRRI